MRFLLALLLFFLMPSALSFESGGKNNTVQNKTKNNIVFSLENKTKAFLPIGADEINYSDNKEVAERYILYDNGLKQINRLIDFFDFNAKLKHGVNNKYVNDGLFNQFPPEYFNFYLSSKIFQKEEYALCFILISKKENRPRRSLYLLSLRNDNLIDSIEVFYQNIGESGFTDTRLFYIDINFILSYQDYQLTDNPILISPVRQFQISSNGKFIRYYKQNGEFQNAEEKGLVQNHTREGHWIETRLNSYIGGFTYLEAEYKEGLPVGEWRYYELEQNYDEATGEPIISTRTKGPLLYTETYKNGELQSRDFVK